MKDDARKVKTFRPIAARFWAIFRKHKLDAEMDDEIRSHIDMQAKENIEAGMKPDQARYAAMRQFGWTESIKETCREQRGLPWLEDLAQDVLYGARNLRRYPGFTGVAILTLALGMGANTAIFSELNGVLFHRLPYPDPERLVRVFRTSEQSRRSGHSVADFLDLHEQNSVFQDLAAFYPDWPFNLAEAGQPAERLQGILATAGFFPTLEVHPILGRVFTIEEDQPGRNQVAVLSYGFWQRRFGGSTNVVGRRLRIDGESVSVIGVMPAGFDDSLVWGKVDLWRPFAFTPSQRQDRNEHWRAVVGRLKPGVSRAYAQAELNLIAERLSRIGPKSRVREGLRIVSLRDSVTEGGLRLLWLVFGLTGSVLLIACANLANLQLSRTTERARELAVRKAVGAAGSRLMRQLLTETLLLCLLGGGLGLLFAIEVNAFVARRVALDVSLDLRVLSFALICSVLTGIVSGVVPACIGSRLDINEALKTNSSGASGNHPHHRLRQTLIIGEVALALILLTGATLFIRGLHGFIQVDPGWRVDGLLTARLDLTSSKYGTGEKRVAFFEQLEQGLNGLSGVDSVAISSSLPVWNYRSTRPISIEGRTAAKVGQEPQVFSEPVSPAYFETLRIRLQEGRTFSSADSGGRPGVVIINQAMARRFWPNESPIGKRIGGLDPDNPRWQEIVGVVADVRFPTDLAQNDTKLQSYRPLAQDPPEFTAIELRARGAPEYIADALRQTVATIDPDLPVYGVETARKLVERELGGLSLCGALLTAFAFLGLTLAAVGIYGVISCGVVRRTAEIGIRIALGAGRRSVLWMVLRQGLNLSLLGTALGLGGAFVVARLLGAAVPNLPTHEPLTIAILAATLIVIGLVASFIPARRATKVDPMVALRSE